MPVYHTRRQLEIGAILEPNIMNRTTRRAEEMTVRAHIGIVIEMSVHDIERLDLIDPLEHIQCIVNRRKGEAGVAPFQVLVNRQCGRMLDIADHMLDDGKPLRGQLEAFLAKFLDGFIKRMHRSFLQSKQPLP